MLDILVRAQADVPTHVLDAGATTSAKYLTEYFTFKGGAQVLLELYDECLVV